MKRVMCLYRVSTKGQVDLQDDIPMQRRECLDFIRKQPDWKFSGELMEKGISGCKVSVNKRDAIQEMRARAERREFDVLLVFMFDRLGRREDETPFMVQWFIEHGIRDDQLEEVPEHDRYRLKNQQGGEARDDGGDFQADINPARQPLPGSSFVCPLFYIGILRYDGCTNWVRMENLISFLGGSL